MNKIKIAQDVYKSVKVMYNVGLWMKEAGLNPSKWWKPENMNLKFLLIYTEQDEYYVAIVNEKPAASMILQETERNQSWKSVDGNTPQKALYLHWLCVHRNFAKQGLPKIMVEFAKKEAKKRGFTLLRLDTNTDKKKLRFIYKGLGLKLMGKEKDKQHTTAFYQISV